jgi:hypothetical protein
VLSTAGSRPAVQRLLAAWLQQLFLPLLAFHFNTGYRLRYDLSSGTPLTT